jgi:hypothetical protein
MLSASSAIAFCQSSPSAAVLTVWPSGTGCLDPVHEWLETSGAEVVHSSAVPLSSSVAELLAVMALYDGEDWLEQPQPQGPPGGPYPGAEWKRQLCFNNAKSREPHLLVLDTSTVVAASSLWSSEYRVRSQLATLSGNPGNSCIHLTDRQDESVLADYQAGARRDRALAAGQGGTACDSSYAYSCARALLHPASVKWLNSAALGLAEPASLGGGTFRAAWSRYTRWLHSPPRSPMIGSCHGRAGGQFEEAPSFLP